MYFSVCDFSSFREEKLGKERFGGATVTEDQRLGLQISPLNVVPGLDHCDVASATTKQNPATLQTHQTHPPIN